MLEPPQGKDKYYSGFERQILFEIKDIIYIYYSDLITSLCLNQTQVATTILHLCP